MMETALRCLFIIGRIGETPELQGRDRIWELRKGPLYGPLSNPCRWL